MNLILCVWLGKHKYIIDSVYSYVGVVRHTQGCQKEIPDIMFAMCQD